MPLDQGFDVVVTGSSGVVGTEVSEALLEAEADVVGVDRAPNRWSKRVDDRTIQMDLLEEEDRKRLPSTVDAVVHLAARSRVIESLRNPGHGLENIESTYRLLEWARRSDVPRVVFVSSREVYGSVPEGRATEGDQSVESLGNPYAASKVGGEALTHAWANAYGLDVIVLRLANVYGRYDLERVVPLFIARAWEGLPLEVYGDKEKILDLVHIKDTARAITRTLEEFGAVAGETFNVGSGEPTSLLEVAEWIARQSPVEVQVGAADHREGEVSRFVADIDRVSDRLGWEPRIGVERGLRDALDWYVNRPELREEILSSRG